MIRYMPKLGSTLWERKSMEYFDTTEELKAFVADQRTKFCHWIGKDSSYTSHDVELISDRDLLWGWNNYCNVVVDGRVIGFCGE